MALKYQPISIDLSRGGLRNDVDSKATTPGELVTLENGVFDKRGVVQKRFGYDVRTPVGWDARTISKGRLLAAVEDELLLFADTAASGSYRGSAVLSLDDASGGQWTPIGRSNPVEVDVKEVSVPADLSQVASYNVMPYVASVGSYDLVASEIRAGSLAGIYLSVTNRATGATLYNQRVRSAGTSPKICATGDYAIILTANGASIFADVWSAADPDTVTVAGAATITDLDSLWDVSEIDTLRMAVAYQSTTGTALRVRVLDTTGGAVSIAATTSATSSTQQNCVSLHRFTVSGTVYLLVTWQDSSAAAERAKYALLSYNVVTLAFALISGPSDLYTTDLTGEDANNITAALETDSTRVRWFIEIEGSATYHTRVIVGDTAFTAMAGSAGVAVRHVGLASKAFTYKGAAWVWVAHESTLQATYFLMTPSAPGEDSALPYADYDAKVLYSRGGGLTYRNGLPAIVDRGNDTLSTAMLKQTQTVNGGIVVRVPVVVTVDMDPVAPRVVKAGRAAYVSGGFVGQAGGAYHEVGHHLFPENLAFVSATAGGLANGAYQIAATYKWIDPLGEAHESAPSPVLKYTVAGGNGTVTVSCPSLAQAARFIPDTLGKDKASDAFVQFYITNTDLTVLYESANAPINDPDADTVTRAINSVNTSAPTLPTTGGVLDNIGPPCMLDLAVHRNRMVGIPADDRTCFWYSKQKVKGAGYEWSDELLVRLDSHGDNTAIASFSDKILVFKRTATYLVPGEGADATGVGGFDTPYLLSGDLGCTDKPSVLTTSVGVIFKSARGFYLYGGGLKYIGGPVQNFDKYDVISAVLEEDSHRAVFFLSDQQPALVYDYLTEQWGTYTDHDAVAASVWQGKVAWLGSDARVHVQSEEFLDGGEAYGLKLGLGWITMAGALGWQRFRKVGVLCDWKSPHTLMLRVYYRRGEVPEDRGTVVTGEDGVEAVRFDLALNAESVKGGHLMATRLPHQKATAIRLEVEDTDPTGEDYTITALMLEVGVRPGFAHLPAAKVA